MSAQSVSMSMTQPLVTQTMALSQVLPLKTCQQTGAVHSAVLARMPLNQPDSDFMQLQGDQPDRPFLLALVTNLQGKQLTAD